MISYGSIFKVTDNSGVKKVFYLKNLTRKCNKVCLGDLIVGVAKSVIPNSKLNYSSIVYCVVLRLKKFDKYSLYSFSDNAVVLVDKNLTPIGSRIFGSVPKILKKKNFLKLNSLSVELI